MKQKEKENFLLFPLRARKAIAILPLFTNIINDNVDVKWFISEKSPFVRFRDYVFNKPRTFYKYIIGAHKM